MGNASQRRALRKRLYALVGGLVFVIMGLVALRLLLEVGKDRIGHKVYSSPSRTLQLLVLAENRFRNKDMDQDGQADFAASLAELEQAGCITEELASGDVKGYRYAVAEAGAGSFVLTAVPAVVTSETLFYCADENGVIRAAVGAPASKDSEVFYHPLRGQVWRGPLPAQEEEDEGQGVEAGSGRDRP